MSSAVFVAVSAPDRHAGDVDRADVAELLLGQEVADVAEVDGVQAVELDDERRPTALLALGVVAVRPHAGQEDVLDLVLAGGVEGEGVLEAARQDVLPSRVRRPLAFAQRRVVGWLYVAMSAVMPRPVGPTTDW